MRTSSITDVARQVGISSKTLRQWEAENRFPFAISRTVGGHRRFSDDQVKWLKRALIATQGSAPHVVSGPKAPVAAAVSGDAQTPAPARSKRQRRALPALKPPLARAGSDLLLSEETTQLREWLNKVQPLSFSRHASRLDDAALYRVWLSFTPQERRDMVYRAGENGHSRLAAWTYCRANVERWWNSVRDRVHAEWRAEQHELVDDAMAANIELWAHTTPQRERRVRNIAPLYAGIATAYAHFDESATVPMVRKWMHEVYAIALQSASGELAAVRESFVAELTAQGVELTAAHEQFINKDPASQLFHSEQKFAELCQDPQFLKSGQLMVHMVDHDLPGSGRRPWTFDDPDLLFDMHYYWENMAQRALYLASESCASEAGIDLRSIEMIRDVPGRMGLIDKQIGLNGSSTMKATAPLTTLLRYAWIGPSTHDSPLTPERMLRRALTDAGVRPYGLVNERPVFDPADEAAAREALHALIDSVSADVFRIEWDSLLFLLDNHAIGYVLDGVSGSVAHHTRTALYDWARGDGNHMRVGYPYSKITEGLGTPPPPDNSGPFSRPHVPEPDPQRLKEVQALWLEEIDAMSRGEGGEEEVAAQGSGFLDDLFEPAPAVDRRRDYVMTLLARSSRSDLEQLVHELGLTKPHQPWMEDERAKREGAREQMASLLYPAHGIIARDQVVEAVDQLVSAHEAINDALISLLE